jgi:RNA polymerase sigma factor FliA
MSNKFSSKEVDPVDLESRILSQLSSSEGAVSKEEEGIVKELYFIVETVAGKMVASKKLPPSVDYSDLLSVGFDGLLKAIRKYDKSSDAQLKTYANIRIRGEILDFIRKEWKEKAPVKFNSMQEQIKKRVSEVVDVSLQEGDKERRVTDLLSTTTTSYMLSLDNFIEEYGDNVSDSSQQVADTAELMFEYGGLNQLILTFTKEDQQFIDLFYRKGCSQKQVAQTLNMSEPSVCRLHKRILLDLKDKIDTG